MDDVNNGEDMARIEGYLCVKLHMRRKRYCVLNGRMLALYTSKEEAKARVPRMQYSVIAVKDMDELEKGTKETLVGSGAYTNALIVSTVKSKVLVIEAETKTEKQRWLHAMMSLNFCSQDDEKELIRQSLSQPDFDGHLAVALLYKYRHNAIATDLIVDELAQYATKNIDDVEFYIQQIVHLLVHSDTKRNTEKLVHLLLSICKGQGYVEHLGNSIHLALQLFWLLESMIHDCKNTPSYNLVALLLMSIEAKVVNQHFEQVHQLYDDVPGLRETILNNVESSSEVEKKALLNWVESERHKRYKYFHEERDFIKAITDISETMRQVEPRELRKQALPGHLAALKIPEKAYIPLGRASDPFCHVLRVLPNEGTVFSTHSRAPCLICFEILQEGNQKTNTELERIDEMPLSPVNLLLSPKHFSGSSSVTDDEGDVYRLIQSYFPAIFSTVENDDHDDDVDQVSSIKQLVDDNIHSTIMRRSSKNAYEMGLAKLMIVDTNAFGESWNDKKKRLQTASPDGHRPGWDLISVISKSNDDMRQEVFALQLIAKFRDIFASSNLPLWLRSYRIVSTGNSTGLIETINDAQSLDALKKRKDYKSLRIHFERTYGDPTSNSFRTAQRNFLHSLAAYSLVSYILQIKDRHNGNILIDTDGRLIHIDFGFLLGIAPGGNWSLESQPPFKLTKEMVEVLGGMSSPMFAKFVQLFTLGFIALQRNAEKIITLVEIMMHKSTFPCFQNRDVLRELTKLRERFAESLTIDQTVKLAMKLIKLSYKNKWTKRYDKFQKITNGIMP
ncbi:phosphatidylinositol kinase (PIK-H2) [Thraustotheca clavata]|uniref:1-phosphatidylinositol 4-kinase n=1 Tax=Thraustotheca clavata TaxID=74557 RepID=A0A1V9YTD1_9STRA|nr:phosphatidylinositol kinase (PIK-H2) [Thraustotheca clavata]